MSLPSIAIDQKGSVPTARSFAGKAFPAADADSVEPCEQAVASESSPTATSGSLMPISVEPPASDGGAPRGVSMRHEQRRAAVRFEEMPGHAAEQPFAHSAAAVGAHHQQLAAR